MCCRLICRYGLHRNFQVAANGLGNIPHRHAFLGDRMIPCDILIILQRHPVKTRDIGNMCCGPAVSAVETKLIIAPVLNTLIGDPKKVFEASYSRIHQAICNLVNIAIRNGDIREDLDPMDLLRALVGVANVAGNPDWRKSARRLIDILIAGSRPVEPIDLKSAGQRKAKSRRKLP